MKLLVFAHTPPPFHGQSQMVKLLLDGFRGGEGGKYGAELESGSPFGIECYHVNAQVSDDAQDVGRMRPQKAVRLLRYCMEAIWVRLRHGVSVFYYIPSPPKRSALYRDWVVMLLCRPWFRRVVFHWHAVGLGEWLHSGAKPWERWISQKLLSGAELSIVLSQLNESDALRLAPKATAVVANGIADPCPRYDTTIQPRQAARMKARRKLLNGFDLSADERSEAGGDPEVIRVLFLAHCTRDKGLFDAIEGVRLANERLKEQRLSLRIRLEVAGAFLTQEEEQEFRALLKQPGVSEWLSHAGFISTEAKWLAMGGADVFCFPTYFANEGQPANIIEAMAFGLAVVSTRWRAILDLLPPGYPALVAPKQPTEVASALLKSLDVRGSELRARFLSHYTLEQHLKTLAQTLLGGPLLAASNGT